MKAKDLIAELEKLDGEAEIIACYCMYCEGQATTHVKVSFDDYESEDRGVPVYIVEGAYDADS